VKGTDFIAQLLTVLSSILHTVLNPHLTQSFMARKQRASLRISIFCYLNHQYFDWEIRAQNPEAYSRVQTKSKNLCERTFKLLVFRCF